MNAGGFRMQAEAERGADEAGGGLLAIRRRRRGENQHAARCGQRLAAVARKRQRVGFRAGRQASALIKQEADRIAETTSQLLAFAVQAPPRHERCGRRMAAAMNSRALASVRCRRKGVRVETDIASNVPAVSGDEEQLRQALEALEQHSEAALDKGCTLEIILRRAPNGVEAVLRDDGPTIPRRPAPRDVRTLRPGARQPVRRTQPGHRTGHHPQPRRKDHRIQRQHAAHAIHNPPSLPRLRSSLSRVLSRPNMLNEPIAWPII